LGSVTRYLHTMYRITDPEKSRAFYEALGLEFRRDMEIVRDGEREATNYFFGVPGQDEELELTFTMTAGPTTSGRAMATSRSGSTISTRPSRR
jgi:catechol 2,3-dioxygenase-like lactoylglutathione lyase family enzyme